MQKHRYEQGRTTSYPTVSSADFYNSPDDLIRLTINLVLIT